MSDQLGSLTPEEAAGEAALVVEQRRRRRFIWHSLLHSPTFLIGSAIVLFWIVMAIFSQSLTADPNAVSGAHGLNAPSGTYLFGTDDLGRDVLARTLAGARPVLIIAPLATLLALVWGATIGLIAGFYRGFIDEIIMRAVDVLLALPTLVVSIMVLSLLGKSIAIVIFVIAVLFTPMVSRTVRSAVLGQREREYVLAARLRGERSWFVMAREVLPNITSPIIVEATVRLGYAVFAAATLSFLGFGLQPPSPDWGLTISLERTFVQVAPWTILFPAIALASLVVGANLMTDGLRRVLAK